MLNRCQQSLNWIPTIPDTVGYSAASQTFLAAPVGKALCTIIQRNHWRDLSIVALLASRGPVAIRRPVVRNAFFAFAAPVAAVVLDTIKRQFGRGSFAHILQKRGKGFSPTSAYRNTALTISRIFIVARIVAAIPKFHPNPVFGSKVLAVPSGGDRHGLQLQASTAQGAFITDGGTIDFGDVATDALTEPHTVAVARIGARVSQHRQPIKGLAFDVKKATCCWFRKKRDFRNVIFFGSHYKNLLDRFAFWLGSIRDPNLWSNCVYFNTAPTQFLTL